MKTRSGKIIRYNNEYDFKVTGIAEPIPSNSSVEFDFIASLSSMKGIKEEKKHTESQLVENGNFRTTFRLKHRCRTRAVRSPTS